MPANIKRIAVNTGGGDAPGLNAVIHAVVYAAEPLGWEVFGVREGFEGLLAPENYPDGGLVRLSRPMVRNIANLGGTILGTTNRGNPLKYAMEQPDGSVREIDRSEELVRRFREAGLDALISIGGDGSLTIALQLSRKGLPVVGVPKTIDNDLQSTVATFGFDSAVSFATECIDRLHSTAESHRRVMVVEVMGRYAGWIALHAGIAGRADAILIPEIPYDIQKVAEHIKRRTAGGQNYAIVVVAEGAKPAGGERVLKAAGKPTHVERLGGIGERVAAQLQELTAKETRAVVFGHLLRGGSPTSLDRLLGLNFGAAAVRALAAGQMGVMVALNPPRTECVPLEQAVKGLKLVPLDGHAVITARALDIALGD
ncbi:MAG TPA: ATP-dependent 6-phosphofructokinase [Phycisphaerae bacterium]|nr:ATP-dependent 6-phosphofructokinase [Phycisphaerae bacterium]